MQKNQTTPTFCLVSFWKGDKIRLVKAFNVYFQTTSLLSIIFVVGKGENKTKK